MRAIRWSSAVVSAGLAGIVGPPASMRKTSTALGCCPPDRASLGHGASLKGGYRSVTRVNA
jgi:hypothetical protein